MKKHIGALSLVLLFTGAALANDEAPKTKRMYNTATGWEQLLRELFMARASVGVGVQGKTLEGKIVGLMGGVLTLEQTHDKGDYIYVPVSSILFVIQK